MCGWDFTIVARFFFFFFMGLIFFVNICYELFHRRVLGIFFRIAIKSYGTEITSPFSAVMNSLLSSDLYSWFNDNVNETAFCTFNSGSCSH